MARILVIDDDRRVREGVVTFLRRLGHDVLEAEDGKRGVRLLETDAADLVITDINMPDMDGIEVIHHLEEAGGCPVIAMSGGGLFDKKLLLDNAKMLGAAHTIQKPFDLADLKALVDKVLESADRAKR